MKKAMTPMISTIVLIVFAAALGALVISWGNAEGLVTATENICSRVDISPIEISGVPQICYDGQNIIAMLKNNGDKEITGVKVITIADQDIITNEFPVLIGAGDVVENYFPLNYEGEIKKVIIEPKIINKLCAKQGISKEYIGMC